MKQVVVVVIVVVVVVVPLLEDVITVNKRCSV